ncbi:unnamed protein product [Discosporangium mesarthrocarpum]
MVLASTMFLLLLTRPCLYTSTLPLHHFFPLNKKSPCLWCWDVRLGLGLCLGLLLACLILALLWFTSQALGASDRKFLQFEEIQPSRISDPGSMLLSDLPYTLRWGVSLDMG